DNDISLLDEILGRISGITPEEDAKLLELEDRLSELVSNGQVVVFTYYADTLDYIFEQVAESEKFRRLRIEKISGRMPPPKREEIVKKFMEGDVQVLMSTDVLSEGMNLQSAQFVINYDLHWNPTRMIQRSGRIDRIGSPYPKIFVYNFFHRLDLVTSDVASKFVNTMVREIGLQLDSYLLDFPEDREWERRWEEVERNLLGMRLTKRRLRDLRKIWRAYKEGHKSWKRLMTQLEEFVVPSVVESREMVEPFDPGKLRLVVIDFIS
ncbi:C-terminal helicase domain-containing protein, partial [Candidatus Hakubella thermalkaliphila]